MAEVIKIDLGGDASEFVTACTAAANAEGDLEKDTKALKESMKKLAKEQKKGTAAADKSAQGHKKVKKEISGLDKVMGSAAGTLKTFMAGWVGIAGIQKAWSMVSEQIREAVAAAEQLANKGRTMESAAKTVMNQTGETYQQSVDRINAMMTTANIADPGAAGEIIKAGNIVWNDREKYTREQEIENTTLTAQFAQRRGLKGGESGLLVEILKQFKAETPEDVKRITEQIFKAQRDALETDFGAFVTGLQGYSADWMSRGASIEDVLSAMAVQRGVTKSSMSASERNKQLTMATDREEVQNILAKENNLTREQWMDQDFATRQEQFGKWVAEKSQTSKGKMLLGDVLTAEEIGRTQAMYTSDNLASLKEGKARYQDTTAKEYDDAEAEYRKLQVSKREKVRAATAVKEISASDEIMMGQDILDQAKAVHGKLLAGEDVTEITEDQKSSFDVDSWFVGAESEIRMVAQSMLKKRIRPLYEEALKAGDIEPYLDIGEQALANIKNKEDLGFKPLTEQGKQLLQARSQIETATGWPSVDVKDIGKADAMISVLEDIRESNKDIRDKTNQGNGQSPADAPQN